MTIDAVALEHVAVLDVSAASGLVFDRGALHVVADDGLHLTRWSTTGAPLGAVRLFEGELPTDPVARKRVKPDLETLALLPDGSLLALGSGSKRNRSRGARIVDDVVTVVDCAPLFDALASSTTWLNIEGASVLGEHLVLLTRRTGREGENRLIRLRLGETLAALHSAAPRLDASLVDDIVPVDLGDIDGTPIGFTDATPIGDDTLLFAAAAETTDDPVLDGPVAAAVLGTIDANGRVLDRRRVVPTVKIEGVAIADDGWIYAVGDADDPRVPSPLVRVPLATFHRSNRAR